MVMSLGNVSVTLDCPACGDPIEVQAAVTAAIEAVTAPDGEQGLPAAMDFDLDGMRDHIASTHPEMLAKFDAAAISAG